MVPILISDPSIIYLPVHTGINDATHVTLAWPWVNAFQFSAMQEHAGEGLQESSKALAAQHCCQFSFHYLFEVLVYFPS